MSGFVQKCTLLSFFEEEKEEKKFDMRAYDKSELALLYCPGRTVETALKTLVRWIKGCGHLLLISSTSLGHF